MNNTKKGDSGAKLIFGNEEWDEKPFFLISLIEHKSRVAYNVIMQLLRYMVFIWIDYEREMKNQTGNKDIVRTKGFKYPPILPIVYYEDSSRWTADMNLAERIMLNEGETICVIKQVCKKLDKAKIMEQMADELEETMETIAKICSAIEKVGVHDAEAIFRIMKPE